jgi:hypothetical protein
MAKENGNAQPDGESVSGYFRKIFAENPKLLRSRSNKKLYQRWLADHPGETQVPDRVKTGLANLKSLLRRKKGRKARASQPTPEPAEAAPEPFIDTTALALEELEDSIDECLTLAKALDREGLESVIQHLRRARNEVVVRLI